MRVLITGASGRIGRALCAELLRRGDEVVGLTRDPDKARGAQPQVTWHAWEPTLERPAAAAFEGVDGVVNLVGERIDQRWTDDAKRKIMDSRRVATHNLVGAIEGLATKPRVLVSQSAVGYYGDRGDETLDEASAPGAGFDAEVCVEWEAAAREVEAAGVRLAIVRTGQVMETGGGILGELLLPFKLGLGGPLAGGRQWVPWIHLSDEIGILAWALDTESVSGVVNGTAPNPVTNKEWSKALGRALHRPAVLPIPGFAVEVKFGKEFGKVAQGGQRVLPRRTEELGYGFKYPEIDGALRNLVG
ncbi:MAG TPA: TIGR01777 family oxidoreductase [Solirubrobacterales bacterium]|nr:TIGR01777 family oxidoreductase [Solirubrobacterales bacterium]